MAFSWVVGSEAGRSALVGGSSGGTAADEGPGAPGGGAGGSLGAGVLLTGEHVRLIGPFAGAVGGDEEGRETLGPTTEPGRVMCWGSDTMGFAFAAAQRSQRRRLF